MSRWSASNANWLGGQCVSCGGELSADRVQYVCPTCGGNLQLIYDYPRISQHWTREILSANTDLTIWRYAPVLPVGERLAGPAVGWTPMIRADRLARSLGLQRLWLKDDGRNPSGSFKDRASAVALRHAQVSGCPLVTGASTGNAASSTAVLAAAVGMRTRIFIPRAAPPAKVAQLLTFGAEVLAVEGTYDQAFDLCLAATDRFGWYNRNTGFNPFTREGKKTAAFEIWEQLGFAVPDWVVVPVGDGNIISGVGKGFGELKQLGFIDRVPRLLAVQAAGSDAVVRALDGDGTIGPVSGETVADSISVSLPRDGVAAVKAVRASRGAGVRVSDQCILAAILDVARATGVFGEPAGVAGYAGLCEAVTQGWIDPESTVVMLVTGNGLKDVASAMRVAGEPHVIAADPAVLERQFGPTEQ